MLFPSCTCTNKGINNSAISDVTTNKSSSLLNEDTPPLFNDNPIANNTNENSNIDKDVNKEQVETSEESDMSNNLKEKDENTSAIVNDRCFNENKSKDNAM